MKGGRSGEPDVGLELVRHGAALGAGGGDGRVRDEGQVIPEKGSTDNQGSGHRQADAGLSGNAGGDGNEGDDGTDTGSDGHGNETGRQEEPGQDKFARQDHQGEVHGGFDAADGLGGTGERSGQHEDPDHQEHVLVTGAAGEYGDLPFQFSATADQDGVDGGQQEGRGHGNLVEVLGNQRGDQVKRQKDDQRAEGEQAAQGALGRDPFAQVACQFGKISFRGNAHGFGVSSAILFNVSCRIS